MVLFSFIPLFEYCGYFYVMGFFFRFLFGNVLGFLRASFQICDKNINKLKTKNSCYSFKNEKMRIKKYFKLT